MTQNLGAFLLFKLCHKHTLLLLLLLLLKSLLSRVTTDVQLYKCQIPIYYS